MFWRPLTSVVIRYFDCTYSSQTKTINFKNFRQENLCDVVLIADTQEIPCHKVVLCACSQYFYAMFTGDLAEAKSNRITLQEIDPSALVLLIDFVYTSEIQVTEENVQVSVKCYPISCMNSGKIDVY